MNSTITTQATVDPLVTSAQIHGFATPETDNSELVRVLYQDPNRESSWRLMGAVRYQRVREFQQASKLHHLDIADSIIIPEHYWIVIQVKPTAILDASNGYFNLRANRARYAIPLKNWSARGPAPPTSACPKTWPGPWICWPG